MNTIDFSIYYKNVIGQSIEFSTPKHIYQCMDHAKEWVNVLNIPVETITRLYAKDVWFNQTELAKKYFEFITDTDDAIPEKGDLIIFDQTKANIAGHISVCMERGEKYKFRSLDQNTSAVSRVSIVTHKYVPDGKFGDCLGYLRPKNVKIV